MFRLLSACVLAVVIVGAPVATAVCQVVCETHQTHEMAAMAEHAHHSHVMADMTVLTAMSVPNACAHPPSDSLAVEQAVRALTAPVLVAVQLSFVPPTDVAALATQSSDIEPSPPGALALIAQLRV